jgi:hypothetical protein
MIYRGVYRDGVVTLQGDVDLPDGSVVEVLPKARATPAKKAVSRRKPEKASKSQKAPKRLSKADRVAAALAVMGDWKDRADFKGRSTLDIAQELRRKARRAGRN